MLRPAGTVPMLADSRARDLWRKAHRGDVSDVREGSNNKVHLVEDGGRQFALKELKSQAVAYPLEDPCTSSEGKIQQVLQEHVPGVVPVRHVGGRGFPGFIMDAVSGRSVDTLKEVSDQPTPFPREVVPDMARFIGGLARAGGAVQPQLTWGGPYADVANTHEALTLHGALSRGYHERFRAEFRPIVKALGLSEGLLGSVDGLMRKHESGPAPLGHRLAPAQMIRDAGGTTWNFDFAGIRRDDPAYLAYRCLDRWNPSETSEQRWDIVREMLSGLPNGGRDPSESDRQLIESLVVGGHVATWGLAMATRLARGTDLAGDMEPATMRRYAQRVNELHALRGTTPVEPDKVREVFHDHLAKSRQAVANVARAPLSRARPAAVPPSTAPEPRPRTVRQATDVAGMGIAGIPAHRNYLKVNLPAVGRATGAAMPRPPVGVEHGSPREPARGTFRPASAPPVKSLAKGA
ncbi:hypothetical protein GCM10023205_63470 [Yinghuangia aomiensis]|uniref:Aminoglycoside phosphotransferase domain-containing protein n=2 Tax=Yinghuangia aomiensis TaxID=676205 RepID=A0ABP9I173_9ACTN